ncbi:MAG: hypothetical protein ACOCTT_01485 [archaeon]
MDKIYIVPTIMAILVILASGLLLVRNLELREESGYIEGVLVAESREKAASCGKSLEINRKPKGEEWDPEVSEGICGSTCRGEWLEEEVGNVTEESIEYLEGKGYDNYLVEAACLAGKPEWIVQG